MVANYVRTRELDEVLLFVKKKKGATYSRFQTQDSWKPKNSKKENMNYTAPTTSYDTINSKLLIINFKIKNYDKR